MLELKRDLLEKRKKSMFRIIVGILFFALSISWITVLINENKIIKPFDWAYLFLFVLNGVIHTTQGFGFSIERLFGNAFVSIDDELISIKSGIWNKVQNVYWKDIKSIDYKVNKYIIQNRDNTNKTLDLSKLSYALKNEIREVIDSIKKEQNK